MTRRNHPEETLQRAVAQYLDLALPEDCWWTSIPAGGGGRIRGAILKGMGYKPGTPDILIIWNGRGYWIELKVEKRGLSAAQKACHDRLRIAGSVVSRCYAVDEVEGQLKWWGLPLRASTKARAA